MELDDILRALESGDITAARAKKMLALHSVGVVEDMARLDLGRARRRGIPEVLLAERKTLPDILSIIERHPREDPLVVSRIVPEHMKQVVSFSRDLGYLVDAGRNSSAVLLYQKSPVENRGVVGILAAGTSDIPVAEEARLVCRAMGCRTICRYDVGVAGLHRIFPALKEMIQEDADCLVVAAGMEGALATLVTSLVGIPVVGVPVSVGYGYGANGVAALASMLQSCALGLVAVNIDGGVAAGAAAAGIAGAARRRRSPEPPDSGD